MTTEWEEIAQPALRQIHAWESEQDSDGYDTHDLAQALDIEDANQVGRQLESLRDAGYITMGDARASGDRHNYVSLCITASGRRELGEWPSEPVTALLNAIEHAIEQHLGGPEEKRLKKLRRVLREISPDVVRALIHSAAQATF